MAYFTAVVARDGRGWLARDVDVDGAEDLGELVDRMRDVAFEDQPVLLLVEREDEWFAVVRVDGEEDPRVFLSDFEAASATRIGQLLGAGVTEGEEGGDEHAGDLDLLDDLGTPAESLQRMSGEDAVLPSDAVSAIAEAAGFAELVEALR